VHDEKPITVGVRKQYDRKQYEKQVQVFEPWMKERRSHW